MKKILYLSYDGLTDPLGQSQIIPYLQKLANYDYRFTILSFEKEDRFIKDEEKIRKLLSPYHIKWKPLNFSTKPPIISKLFDAMRMKKNAYSLQKGSHFDMIHCRSYLAADVGLSMKKRRGINFFFDMRGFWADEKVDSGQWKQNNPFFRYVYRYYKHKEKKFLLEADAIVSLTEAAKNEIRKNPVYTNVPVDVIPCCTDLEHFNYERFNLQDINERKKQLGITSDQKIILYLGSVGGWYMTREMFSFYKQLLEKYPSFVMLFLTKDDPAKVLAVSHAAGIPDNKIIVTYTDRNKLPEYLSISDFSIFFIRPTYSKIASSPTKHAELMGMGIPVICNDIGDTGTIVRNTKSGLIIEQFSEQGYEYIINRLPELLAIEKKHIREAAFQYFDLGTGVAKYLEIYKRVIGS